MMQEEMFFDDLNDALRHLVSALGGAKVVGAAMRADLKPDHAARWLMDCLNADRRENLSPEHLMHLLRMGREKGIHAGMHYLSAEVGYESKPVEPDDEAAALRRQYVESAKQMAKIAARIEEMDRRSTVRSVA